MCMYRYSDTQTVPPGRYYLSAFPLGGLLHFAHL